MIQSAEWMGGQERLIISYKHDEYRSPYIHRVRRGKPFTLSKREKAQPTCIDMTGYALGLLLPILL